MTILEAMLDEKLFRKWFKPTLLRGDTWKAARAFLAALFALPMDDEARAIYERHTGRTDSPVAQFGEAFVIAGRRAGKSLIAAFIAVFLACFRDYSGVLAAGETGVVMILAADRRQARVILGYINGFFDAIPMLGRLVKVRLKESIELTNGLRIEVHTASYKSVRGFTVVAAICDEIAFWPSDESANPDTEILSALRPAMATVPGSLLLAISSPYARRGVLYEAHRDHFGKNGSPVLVWKSSSREMNSTINPLTIAASRLMDPSAARSEWDGEFRDDISTFIPQEVVESAIIRGRFELPRADHDYFGFCDPSGGSSDSFTLAVAHCEGDRAVLDCLRERVPPFSPESVVKEFSDTLKSYGLTQVTGDKYAGEFPRELFSKRGITYRVAERTRSELYLELLPALMSGRVELLNNARLVAQLCTLERRTARGGRDSVDHGVGSHDDCANSVAGALVGALDGHGGVLGLLEYEQLEAAGKLGTLQTQPWSKEYLFQFEAKVQGLQPTAPAPTWKQESLPPCPNCKSSLTMRVSASQVHCNQCKRDFFPDGPPKVYSPNRRDFLAGNLPSARTFNFQAKGEGVRVPVEQLPAPARGQRGNRLRGWLSAKFFKVNK